MLTLCPAVMGDISDPNECKAWLLDDKSDQSDNRDDPTDDQTECVEIVTANGGVNDDGLGHLIPGQLRSRKSIKKVKQKQYAKVVKKSKHRARCLRKCLCCCVCVEGDQKSNRGECT